jgi:hypothetical protein
VAGEGFLEPEHQAGHLTDGADARGRVAAIAQAGDDGLQGVQTGGVFRGGAGEDFEQGGRAGAFGHPEGVAGFAARGGLYLDHVQAGLVAENAAENLVEGNLVEGNLVEGNLVEGNLVEGIGHVYSVVA